MLVRVVAPHFVAGMVMNGDTCTEAAPILRWAIGKRRGFLSGYFRNKGWEGRDRSLLRRTLEQPSIVAARRQGDSMRWIADYACLQCCPAWSEPAGPTECPSCGWLYVRWTNYEALAAGPKPKPRERLAAVAGSYCPAPCVAVTAAGSLPGKQQRL